ncbi:MAG: DEAD/DEAH box helicase [Chitinophagaceae bacterium]
MNESKPQKKQVKVTLLLTPEEFNRNYQVLQSLHIERSAAGINYDTHDLNRREVEQHFPSLSREMQNALLRFQLEAIEKEKQHINQRFSAQKAGIPAKEFKRNAFLRYFSQLFQHLLTHSAELKLYHKIKIADRYQVLPCTLSSANLRLDFDVIKNDQGFDIQVSTTINGDINILSSFRRTGFLIEKAHVYYLLSHKDFQTIEWLVEYGSKDYGQEQSTFAEKILARLEKDYKVNRNGLLEEKEISVTPTSRVLLSELNNTFLLLTPQWLYDDILIDGPWKPSSEITINGERIVITRDNAAEQQFLTTLTELHPNFSSQPNGYFYLTFADAQKKQWFSKIYHTLLDQNIEVAGMDMLSHFRYSQYKADTSFSRVREEGSSVFCTMSVAFGNESISLSQLQKALYAGQRAILLKDGSLGILNEDWFREFEAIIKHGYIRGSEIRISRFLSLPDSGSHEAGLSDDLQKEWWRKWKLWQTNPEPMYPLPGIISATLRPYQQKGFDWLSLLAEAGAGGCLADDMGLGKTLQAIAFLARYIEQYPDKKHLIVCPTSLVYNWQQELQKFAGALTVDIFQAGTRTMQDGAKILITSYGLLRNNSAWFTDQQFGVAILDESHNIKNPAAQITRVVNEIRAGIRVTLSGTPVINNTEDLYSQIEFSLPGLLGTREFFKREYAHPIDRAADEGKIKALQKLTAPFILRRTKAQVARDLPEKTQSILWCTMSAGQKTLYDNIRDRIKSRLLGDIHQNGLNKSKMAVLQGLLRLRQICNDPRLLPAEEQEDCRDSVKVDVLMDELTNILGEHKVLVFSQFSSMLALLAEAATAKGIPYFLLDGKTPAEKRMQLVNEFQEGADSPSLFFISLKAGNTGLNLTAADYVFLFDPWWNTAVEDQAVDRTYRIGQKRNVFAYKMICKDSIEERIIELQKRKKFVADELISADEGFVRSLTEEDVLYLLQ